MSLTTTRPAGATLSAPLILSYTESRHEDKGTCHGLSWSNSLFSTFSPTPLFALALAYFGLLHSWSHLLRWQKRNLVENSWKRVIVCHNIELSCLRSAPVRDTGRIENHWDWPLWVGMTAFVSQPSFLHCHRHLACTGVQSWLTCDQTSS